MGFRHEAFLYESPGELVEETVPFIHEGLAGGGAVLVAVPERSGSLIRAEVDEADDVEFVDVEDVGRNPARIIPVWQRFVSESLARRRSPRGIGEPIYPGRGEVEVDECERHEALLNVAFDEGPDWALMCPYDAGWLPDPVIERVTRTHPCVATRGGIEASPSYSATYASEAAFAGTFADPPLGAGEVSFGEADLAALRNFVSEHALRLGLPLAGAADLVVAANELATNSLRHGGGTGKLRIWNEETVVVCEVRDAGRFSDPLAGRRFPPADASEGRGLWIANQLCDLVQVRSSAFGSAVRLRMGQAEIE